jgi:hypothetical protein
VRGHELSRLDKGTRHRLEAGKRAQRGGTDAPLLARFRQDLLAHSNRIWNRHRAEQGCTDEQVEALRFRAGVARPPRVFDCPLERLDRRRRPAPKPRRPSEKLPDLRQQAVVAGLLESLH